MEQLISFFVSEEGKILCYVLFVLGVLDVILPRVLFSNKITKLEEELTLAVSTEERESKEKKLQAQKMIIHMTTFGGLAFVAIAIFGLTR